MMISATCAAPPPMLFSGNDELFQFQCQETRLIEELMCLVQQGTESKSTSTSPNSSESNRGLLSVDERKRRRMTSNLESARRSRWRKKRHLEDLDEEANRLRVTNRELKNRLGFAAEKCRMMWRENETLESEALALRARLLKLNRVLVAMQMMQSHC